MRNNIHSASLLAQADVIIDMATLVTIKAIKRGIPVLAADYLHAGPAIQQSIITSLKQRCAVVMIFIMQ